MNIRFKKLRYWGIHKKNEPEVLFDLEEELNLLAKISKESVNDSTIKIIEKPILNIIDDCSTSELDNDEHYDEHYDIEMSVEELEFDNMLVPQDSSKFHSKLILNNLLHDKSFKDLSYGYYIHNYREDLVKVKQILYYDNFRMKEKNLIKFREMEKSGRYEAEKRRLRKKKHKKWFRSQGKCYNPPTFNNSKSALTANRLPDVGPPKVNYTIKDQKVITSINTISKLDPSTKFTFQLIDDSYQLSENGLYIEFPNKNKFWSYLKLFVRHKSLIKDVDISFKAEKINHEFHEVHKSLIMSEWERLCLISR